MPWHYVPVVQSSGVSRGGFHIQDGGMPDWTLTANSGRALLIGYACSNIRENADMFWWARVPQSALSRWPAHRVPPSFSEV